MSFAPTTNSTRSTSSKVVTLHMFAMLSLTVERSPSNAYKHFDLQFEFQVTSVTSMSTTKTTKSFLSYKLRRTNRTNLAISRNISQHRRYLVRQKVVTNGSVSRQIWSLSWMKTLTLKDKAKFLVK